MKPTAVQFGAGNIGRGFIAQLFHETGYEVVFVDVVPPVIAALNERHEYRIRIVGPDAHDVPINDVRAVDGNDRAAAAEEVAGCAVACTAVGAGALKYIAPNLAAGLLLRHQRGLGPLNVLVCENLHGAGAFLRGLVADNLPADARDAVLAETGFVQAVVSRMVPIQHQLPGESTLDIHVEAYKRLPVDAQAVKGTLPSIVGVEPVANFEAYEARKLYTHNCAHATLGYLGYLRGIEFGYQALADPEIRTCVDAVLAETAGGLIGKFGLDPDEHREHVQDLLNRFTNVALGDTCYRLARDPIRKLAPGDRLSGAARMCQEVGIEPKALASVIAAALHFDASDDPSSVELQRRIRENGIDQTMADVSGVSPTEPLGIEILRRYSGTTL